MTAKIIPDSELTEVQLELKNIAVALTKKHTTLLLNDITEEINKIILRESSIDQKTFFMFLGEIASFVHLELIQSFMDVSQIAFDDCEYVIREFFEDLVLGMRLMLKIPDPKALLPNGLIPKLEKN